MIRRKKITQKDIEALRRLKNKAIHNQWYEIAAKLRDSERQILQRVDAEAVEDILDVVRKESLKKICPNGHKYIANPNLDFCPKCIKKKTEKQQPKNN